VSPLPLGEGEGEGVLVELRPGDALTPTLSQGEREVRVECYAGARYPERPTALVWANRRVDVQRVEREWQAPGRRHFVVRTDDGRFHLTYHEDEDRWQIEQA
jgi:hypothetical protein